MNMKIICILLIISILQLYSANSDNNETESSSEAEVDLGDKYINVGITFTKVSDNESLKKKFKLCISSVLKYATVNLKLFIIGDKQSQYIAKNIISKVKNVSVKYQVSYKNLILN